ncbi:MAG: rhodanese-like domain-containing protein [Anaerolineales bacterium]
MRKQLYTVCGIAIVHCAVVNGMLASANDLKNGERVADALPPSPINWGGEASGPLCGVYAACTAAELIGIDADPRDFISKRYVGACGGSSPKEVARIAKHAGAKAHIMIRLSALDLRIMDCPLVANVRISPASDRFNHWVVAVPSKEGVTIYDGLQKPFEVPTAAFLGNWSGIGICVTAPENSPLASIWLGRSSLLLGSGIAGVLAFRKRTPAANARGPSVLQQLSTLCMASVILSVAGNLVFGDLLNHTEGVRVASASSRSEKYAIGTLEDANLASASRDVLLIDARREQDYRLGTIEGAINIPVSASIWAIDRYLEKVDRDIPIVVFCQSARCGYDETIGGQLASLGFSDVTVCDEGWAEYQQAMALAN